MGRLIVHQDAKSEIRDAARYYDEKRKGLGKEFLAAIEELFRKIRRNPRRCGFVTESLRSCRVRKFPYAVVYRLDEDAVFIAAVAHFKRQPGYWESRDR